MKNQQANEAGQHADDLIKNLANPSAPLVTDNTEVQVVDKAKPIEVEAPKVEPQPPSENWENRFKGFKASTDKTIHTLRQQVSQFDLMKGENETLKKQLEEAQAKTPSSPDEMLNLFSQEELDGFNKMVEGKVGGLQSEVDSLQTKLNHAQEVESEALQANAHQQVVDAVAAAVPNYREIDYDPEFAAFMNEPDTFGNIRKDLLIRAKHSNPPDISRIVQFYVEFGNNKPAQEEQQPSFTQQELLQTPSSTPSSGKEMPQGTGIVWDTATISQFYKDKAVGKISPQRAAELEQDLYNSQRKG